MQLTNWEWAELHEHLSERPDIWQESDSKWYRSRDGFLRWVLLVKEPTGSGPFRMHTLYAQSVVEDEAPALQELVSGYTSYDTRMRIVSLLIDELAVPAPKAQLAAIAMLHITYTGEATPHIQCDEAAVQAVLPGFDVPGTIKVGLWPLASTGYVAFDLINDRMHATISVPASHGRGFGPLWKGFVHPAYGTSRQMAGLLAGWDVVEAASDTPQLELPLEDSDGAS